MSPLFAPLKGGSFAVVFWPPETCKGCKTLRSFFVNRDGKTRCVDCDAEYRKERAPRRPVTRG